MTVTKGIVDLHGGTISVFSAGEGRGTTFTVKLPVYRIAKSSKSSRQSSMNISLRTPHLYPINGIITAESLSEYESRSQQVELRSSTATKVDGIVPSSEWVAGSLQTIPSVSARSSFSAVMVHAEDQRRLDMAANEIRPCEEEEKGSNGKSYRFLLVDDVPLTRKMMRRMLMPFGSTVDEAADGIQAIEMVRASISVGLPYDVILMDHQMPRMCGPEAAAAIRQLGYIGVIVGVSGHVLEEDEVAFLSQGANRVVSKPLEFSKLNSILQGG